MFDAPSYGPGGCPFRQYLSAADAAGDATALWQPTVALFRSLGGALHRYVHVPPAGAADWGQIRQLPGDDSGDALHGAVQKAILDGRAAEWPEGGGIAFPAYGAQGRAGCFLVVPDVGADARYLAVAALTAHGGLSRRIAAGAATALLSARERDVLGLVARGHSTAGIGDALGISRHTADAYLRRAFTKLEANDRASAVVRALGQGLIGGV